MEAQAIVNKIIPFSSVDGPGNRTAIFLQGCNIDCKYCHNPETRKICIGCGECVSTCPTGALLKDENGHILYDADKCVECDTCIKTCSHDSSPRVRLMTVDEVYDNVKKQMPFIRGITVSGGECMLQPEFVKLLFEKAKADGLTTLIDSNGTVSFAQYPKLLEVTDGVMLDIKAFDAQEHQEVTGMTNEIVLKNAAFLAENKKLYEVRAVIVPDLYDTNKSIRAMGEFLRPYLKIKPFRIKLIAYRPMGVREEYSHYQVPDQAYMEELKGVLEEMGYEEIIII